MDRKLTVPENISLRKELWPGFGGPEAIKTGLVVGAVLPVSAIFCALTHQDATALILTITGITAIAIGISIFQRLENNLSIYDFVLRQIAFKREQQAFLYHRKEGGLTIEFSAEKGQDGPQALNGPGVCER